MQRTTGKAGSAIAGSISFCFFLSGDENTKKIGEIFMPLQGVKGTNEKVGSWQKSWQLLSKTKDKSKKTKVKKVQGTLNRANRESMKTAER